MKYKLILDKYKEKDRNIKKSRGRLAWKGASLEWISIKLVACEGLEGSNPSPGVFLLNQNFGHYMLIQIIF